MKTVAARPVLTGAKVKFTLEQVEQQNQDLVRIDWLRFTLPLDAVCKREPHLSDLTGLELLDQSGRDLVRMARSAEPEFYTSAHRVSHAGACQLVALLGCLEVGQIEHKGMDYYSARTALSFAGETVGWVLAGSKSFDQASTIHFNLFGSAMLQIPMERLAAIAQLVKESGGKITRCDLSLDVWSGHRIEDVRTAYLEGEFDVRGKRPGQREHGSWTLGHSRTFEVGSRETGKMCRGYEKGDQLFGAEANSEWIRYEVEMRDKHRVIDAEILVRPADYFAGAYEFCARVLAEQNVQVHAKRIRTNAELADVTAEAAVLRVIRWVKRSAAPALVAVFDMGGDLLADLVDSERHRLPRRLHGICPQVLRDNFKKVAQAMAPAYAPSFSGAV